MPMEERKKKNTEDNLAVKLEREWNYPIELSIEFDTMDASALDEFRYIHSLEQARRMDTRWGEWNNNERIHVP